MIIKSH